MRAGGSLSQSKGKYGHLDPNLRAQLDEQPEKRLETKESCEGRRG
jgi:hypothetical protein